MIHDLAIIYSSRARSAARALRRDSSKFIASGCAPPNTRRVVDTNSSITASNYAVALVRLKHFEETKALMRKTIPVARRVLGDSNALTLRMRMMYAVALYRDPTATRDDLREAVAMLEDTERIARRVLGGTHPLTEGIESCLRHARAALNAREE